MTPITLLRLGRVSNLPTVWSNALVGLVLAGQSGPQVGAGVVVVALSLLYVAGMVLNDWFDRHWDARHRPERPIPAGDAAPGSVAALGAGLLAAGGGLLAVVGFVLPGGVGWPPVAGGAGLAAAIVLYDAWHKGNPAASVVMGLCRALVVVTAATTVAGTVPAFALVAAAALLVYVSGLTVVARTAGHGPVALLIAGISLLDAAFLVMAGAPGWAAGAVGCFALTLVLQRWVRGT